MGHSSGSPAGRVAIFILQFLVALPLLAVQPVQTQFHLLDRAQWEQEYAAAKAQTPNFRVESLDAFEQIALYYEQLASEGTVRNEFDLATGDHIRCVDIDTQLAAANFEGGVPPLRRTRPSGLAEDPAETERAAALGRAFGLDGSMDEGGHVRACPDGTVAKRIPFFEDLLHFENLREYLRKDPRPDLNAATPAPSNVEPPAIENHEYGHAYRFVNNFGGSAAFNVWSPFIEQQNEFSLSQMWVVNGSGTGLQTLESGWQAYPARLHDNLPRVFVYSTPDGYNRSGPGCYEPCGRFFYTSANSPVGLSLTPSVLGGTQTETTFQWYRDSAHDWWLAVNGAWIGYYPHTYFNSSGLLNQAALIDFGGEIVDTQQQGVHTTTHMGSGKFAQSGFANAAYIRFMQYTDTGYTLRDATSLTFDAPTPSYYNVALVGTHDTFWGNSSLFFGGPGRAFSNTTLQSASPSPSTVSAGSTFSIQYGVNATSPDYVMLGASIRPSGGTSTISDPAHDTKISLAAGTWFTSRSFQIPAGTAAGSYDLIVAIWRDMNTNGAIDGGDQVLGSLTYTGAITIPAPVTPPSVTTNSASSVTASTAQLNGSVNPNGGATDTAFLWGTSISYDKFITRQTLTGSTSQSISASISNLTCGTTYHYAAWASNSAGTRVGDDVTFLTSACPCSYQLVSPNGGEVFQRGQNAGIAWQSSNCSSTTRIDLYQSNQYQVTLAAAANVGSFQWSIPVTQTPGSDYTIRVSDASNNSGGDFSDGFFTITSGCSIVTPAISAPVSVGANSAGNAASATASGAVSYQWSIVNGAITSATTSQSITFTAGASGSVTLVVTATDSGGCSAQSQKTISITALSARKVRGDFNGNGTSDIFWRNSSTGDHSIWYVNGAGFQGGPTGPPR